MVNIIENDGTLISPQAELIPYNDDSFMKNLLSQNKIITPRHLGAAYSKHLCSHSKGEILTYETQEPGSQWTLNSQKFLQGTRAFAHFLLYGRPSKSFATVLLLENHPYFFVPVVGTWLAGASVSPLQPSASKEAIRLQLNMLKDELKLDEIVLVVQWDCLGKVSGEDLIIVSLCPVQGFVSLECIMEEKVPPSLGFLEEDRFPTSEIAVTFWTSGSTGEPKGVLYTALNILKSILYCSYIPSEIQTLIKNYEPSNLRLMFLSNLFHPGGFTEGLRGIYPQRRTGIILHQPRRKSLAFSNRGLLKAVSATRPHMIICSPETATQLKEEPRDGYDLSSVVAIYPIGGSLRPNLVKVAKSIFPSLELICRGYGSTETLSISLGCGSSETHMGKLFPCYQMRILSPSGEILGPNEIGDIVVKPGFGMNGYIGKGLRKTPDGFLYMGDVGYYDSFGRIFFKSRSKDLIKIHNHHVYPQEMEAFIVSKCLGVVDVGVFGLEDKNGMLSLAAVVVPLDSETDIEYQVEKACERHMLPNYKWLHGGVKIVRALPRNSNGKILRGLLSLVFKKSS